MSDSAVVSTRRQLHAVAENLIAGPQYRAAGTIRLAVRADGFTYQAVEFHGAESLSLGSRMTLCSMTTEMGAKAGLIAPDAQTSAYGPVPDWLAADDNADYCDRIVVDLGEIQPWVACPPRVDSIAPAGSLN